MIKLLMLGWAMMGAVMAQDCDSLTKKEACLATMETFCTKEESCGGMCLAKNFYWCDELEGTADAEPLQACLHDIRWANCRGTGVELTPRVQECLAPYLPVEDE